MEVEITKRLSVEVTNHDYQPKEIGDRFHPDSEEDIRIYDYKLVYYNEQGHVVHEKEGSPFKEVFDWDEIKEEILNTYF